MISKVRSWSSLSRARSFFALSDRGRYSSSSGGEPAGDCLAADLAGPFGVGAVQSWRAAAAAAIRLAAGVKARTWRPSSVPAYVAAFARQAVPAAVAGGRSMRNRGQAGSKRRETGVLTLRAVLCGHPGVPGTGSLDARFCLRVGSW
jgi:hypothetical protein